jgi:ABC-2 type transport system permease protein
MNATTTDRALSPTAEAMHGSGSLLLAQVRSEFLQLIRVPEFVVGVVGVPVILYTMFGLPNAGQKLPGGTDVALMLLASFGAYGIVSQAIFTFGVDVARERGQGWLRRLRATPMPMWAYFGAKVVSALAFTVLIWLGQVLVGRFGAKIDVPLVDLLKLLGVLLVGTVAFCTFGFAIAYWFRPKAAAAVGNLIFLPLSFCSGFFQPLSGLPEVFRTVAPYLPTYHYGYLAWGQVSPAQDIEAFTGGTSGSVAIHAGWVLGAFLVFAVLTVVGYRRDLDRERS